MSAKSGAGTPPCRAAQHRCRAADRATQKPVTGHSTLGVHPVVPESQIGFQGRYPVTARIVLNMLTAIPTNPFGRWAARLGMLGDTPNVEGFSEIGGA